MINRQIRHSLENGEIDRAIELLKAHASCILEDHRILFRLEKQVWLEIPSSLGSLRVIVVSDQWNEGSYCCLRGFLLHLGVLALG
ncbi:hypothetical protein MLD38_028595 [Melastoma candidum]|uniref:Uncharacterized protein n=1 Tax=Melastoma candidum TaxID=119954 RepID=A0ACB9N186_9MYRT|nr:hypothetical protein MLD38_028595 [Melastoma candidum]